jgi:outer membrane protein assembly factor BamB
MRLLPLAVLMLVAATTHAADHWPQFRGPGGDGRANEAKLPVSWSETQNVRWKTAIHGKGWSSPVVWGDSVWLTTATEDGHELFAVCVDRPTGEIVHDVKLFDVASPGYCPAMNSYASPTPVIEEGRVWVHFGSNGTACLDTRTGKIVWSRQDLPCNHHRGAGSSPILFEDLLILTFDGFDRQYLAALDKHSGRTVWKEARSIDYGTSDGDLKKAFGTPTVVDVSGRPQLVSPSAKGTVVYDPRTGTELWKLRSGGMNVAARPLAGEGLVFANSGLGGWSMFAVRPDGLGDVSESHVVWKYNKSVPTRSSQLLIDGLLYMVSDGGVATCLEAQTGRPVWQKRLGENYSASPIYASGRIYFFSENGSTTVIKAAGEYEVLSVNQLSAGCMASPAVAGDTLYLRTITHLYAIESAR